MFSHTFLKKRHVSTLWSSTSYTFFKCIESKIKLTLMMCVDQYFSKDMLLTKHQDIYIAVWTLTHIIFVQNAWVSQKDVFWTCFKMWPASTWGSPMSQNLFVYTKEINAGWWCILKNVVLKLCLQRNLSWFTLFRWFWLRSDLCSWNNFLLKTSVFKHFTYKLSHEKPQTWV